ncbi:MAG: hypothetical protein GF320_10630 [Armatimonadia bacterium]|nr:hypothetical protein [Armatimonadia bacterium]
MKKLLIASGALGLLTIALVVATSCSPTLTGVTVNVDANDSNLAVGESTVVTATVRTTGTGVVVTDRTVAWTSQPAGAVSFSSATSNTGNDGQAAVSVTGQLPGTVTIDADAGAGSGSTTVTVTAL